MADVIPRIIGRWEIILQKHQALIIIGPIWDRVAKRLPANRLQMEPAHQEAQRFQVQSFHQEVHHQRL